MRHGSEELGRQARRYRTWRGKRAYPARIRRYGTSYRYCNGGCDHRRRGLFAQDCRGGHADLALKVPDGERGNRVIMLEECIALCGLTEQEVKAIAEHEHMPEIAAAAMAKYLLKEPHGAEKIRDM